MLEIKKGNTMTKQLGFFVLFAAVCFAKDDRGMIIYGHNFCFSLTEPIGWAGKTDDAAQYSVNVYFTKSGTSYERANCIMNARVMDKNNEDIKTELEYDMKEFRKKYSRIIFGEFKVDSLRYPIYSKIYDYGNGTTDYCCYINPGKDVKLYFIIVMSGKKDVCKKEEKTFRELIKSFTWLTDTVHLEK